MRQAEHDRAAEPTISRYTAVLVPLVKSVLEEFVPDAAEAIEMVRGRGVLVDDTLTLLLLLRGAPAVTCGTGTARPPVCNAQLIALLDVECRLDAAVSGPLPGEDPRREGIQGDRGRRYRERIRWRIRG